MLPVIISGSFCSRNLDWVIRPDPSIVFTNLDNINGLSITSTKTTSSHKLRQVFVRSKEADFETEDDDFSFGYPVALSGDQLVRANAKYLGREHKLRKFTGR